MSNEKNMMKKATASTDVVVEAGYKTNAGFDLVQRVAQMFAQSSLVPDTYQGNLPNCVIALEMAQRIGASPLMTMQNMYIVHGRPAWSSQFLISCLNASGRFSPLRYRETGKRGTDSYGIVAWAKDLADGEVLEGPEVTLTMAKAEGWYQKKGSKWQTMPELMARYRAATFFARLYAPELTMGIRTTEEAVDIPTTDVEVGGAPYVEVEVPEKKEPAPKKKPAEKREPAAAEKPASEASPETPAATEEEAAPNLRNPEDMKKAELLTEVLGHSRTPEYTVLVLNDLPEGTTVMQCGVTQLREYVLALRDLEVE